MNYEKLVLITKESCLHFGLTKADVLSVVGFEILSDGYEISGQIENGQYRIKRELDDHRPCNNDILNYLSFKKAFYDCNHDGDCVKFPRPCSACVYEEYFLTIIQLLGLPMLCASSSGHHFDVNGAISECFQKIQYGLNPVDEDCIVSYEWLTWQNKTAILRIRKDLEKELERLDWTNYTINNEHKN